VIARLRFQLLDLSHDENELDRGLNGALAIETRPRVLD